MSINIHYERNNIKRISVWGQINSEDEIKKLIEAIDIIETNNYELHITFTDQNILPAHLVEKLHHRQKNRGIRINVLKRYLYSYLNSLGIDCRYLETKFVAQRIKMDKQGTDSQHLNTEQVMQFLNQLNKRYGYDYSEYLIESIMRRIKISMLREGVTNFTEFQHSVLYNPNIFEQVFIDFSINTTEFFRDPEVFSAIRERILPSLKFNAFIRIWCAGCSNGKEPYSLAILLQELGILDKTRIYATDINPLIVEEAKNGLFATTKLDKEINSYRQAGGVHSFDEYFDIKDKYMKIKPELKKNILFFQHSLVGNGILNEFHLIFCRNVFIYFNPHLQKKVLKNFHNSLHPSGLLLLGKSEGMLQNEGYKYFSKYLEKEKIFRKK